jgi:hypothetical protein
MWGLWGRIARAMSKYRISRSDSEGFRAGLSAACSDRVRYCSTCCSAIRASVWSVRIVRHDPTSKPGHQSVTNDGLFRPILSEMPRKIGRFSLPRLRLGHKRLTRHMESPPTYGAGTADRGARRFFMGQRRPTKRNHAAKPPTIPPVTSLTSLVKTAHGRGARFLDARRGKRG